MDADHVRQLRGDDLPHGIPRGILLGYHSAGYTGTFETSNRFFNLNQIQGCKCISVRMDVVIEVNSHKSSGPPVHLYFLIYWSSRLMSCSTDKASR